jgi:hypothetical protein
VTWQACSVRPYHVFEAVVADERQHGHRQLSLAHPQGPHPGVTLVTFRPDLSTF